MFVLVGAMEREVRCGSVVAIDLALTLATRTRYEVRIMQPQPAMTRLF